MALGKPHHFDTPSCRWPAVDCTCLAIDQMKPTSSRAIAAVITVGLSGARELAIAAAQPFLSLPGNVTDRLDQAFLSQQLLAADPCGKAIAPCRLDEHPSSRAVTGLSDPALAACTAAGMFGWHQAKICHELAGIAKAGDVPEFRHQV